MAKKDDKPKRSLKSNKASKKTLREQQAEHDVELTGRSLWSAFWKGFFLPIRLIWRGLAWLVRRPPLKQIGHGLRWFFTRKPMRFIGRLLGFRYIYESFKELRGVTWPSFKDSVKLTRAVVIFSVLFGAFVAGIDWVLDKVFKEILL